MIVSPASSPNPNHSGLWSVWLTIAGRIINREAVLNTEVLFFGGFSPVYMVARAEGYLV